MGLIVQKYGGTSVATPRRIKSVAERVLDTRLQGHDVVVVVSAMGRTTDELVRLAGEVTERPSEREMDMLLSTGETISIALLAMAIRESGGEAISFTGAQCGILTSPVHQNARILRIDPDRLRAELARGRIVVVAGFQGISPEEEVTTLGRGGSDTTAVALACALGADRCEILTDVDGVYTADPRVVPDARKIAALSYDEMLELAGAGAGVLKDRAVELAAKHGVVLHVRSSFDAQEGTLVMEETEMMEEALVQGIAHTTNEARVTVRGAPARADVAAVLFGPLADAHISVDMIIQSANRDGTVDISFTVAETDFERTLKLVETLRPALRVSDVVGDRGIAKVAVVGVGMRSHAGVAATLFRALAEAGIQVKAVSTSEVKIACLVSQRAVEEAVRALHRAFRLEGPRPVQELREEIYA